MFHHPRPRKTHLNTGMPNMNRVRAGLLGLLATPFLLLPGCGHSQKKQAVFTDPDLNFYQTAATQVEFNDEVPTGEQAASTPAPLTFQDDTPAFREISLQECIQLALQNNEVMRDLGGVVLRTPAALQTVYSPGVQESEPRLGLGLVGPEAALSAFDAQLAANAFLQRVERADNNSTLINTFNGPSSFKQDLGTFQAELSKIAATGTRFAVRNTTEYDANNATLNTFGSSWAVNYEMEARHPLLQGGGIDFNRIAGPQAVPGIYTGILLARINTDIALSDFEVSVRNLVNDVENAYLDLYYAYRDLDSKIAARDAALETWRSVNALYELERKGGEAFREAQAREQYFRFQEEVQNSMQGKLFEGTRGNNGSSGGTFRAGGGVLVAERRLRLLLGIPISDCGLLRPTEEPEMAEVVFDWNEVLQEALTRRVEIRRQKWNVKSRKLEIQAAKNFLLPRLDLVGRYNWNGFGRDLFQQHGQAAATRDLTNPLANYLSRYDNRQFNNAYNNLFSGDFQGWTMGAELSMPIGFRRGHAAVTNAEFRLARDVAILREQEREVVHDLSNAIAETKRAYGAVETNYNRRLAAKQQLDAVEAAYEADTAGAELDDVLDAQRRLADAESNYYRSLIEYASSIKNVHYEKGSLLDYNGIFLEEGPWPAKAYEDAARKQDLRCRPWPFWGPLEQGKVISSGPAPQLVLPHSGMGWHGELTPAPNMESGADGQAPMDGDLAKPPAPTGTTNTNFQPTNPANFTSDLEAMKPMPRTEIPNLAANPFTKN
jgi:outer membrane protein TolC